MPKLRLTSILLIIYVLHVIIFLLSVVSTFFKTKVENCGNNSNSYIQSAIFFKLRSEASHIWACQLISESQKKC